MNESIGQEAPARILDRARAGIREAIAEAGGREVFFAGSLDSDGLVHSIRVMARGHEGAVPAVFEGLDSRDVVIHNHPSGGIGPSEADLELAVVYSHNGHGVYIVDNDVSQVYVVVEPFLDKNRSLLDPTDLAARLAPGGTVADCLPDFEVRPQQAEMMEAIAQAFNRDGVAVIEAPTGVGKTLAYLLPAALWAIRNRERVVISTRTINLQEQIILKDIPLLQRALDEEFSAVLVKGRSNYLCRRRLEGALSEASLFEDEEEEGVLQSLAKWAEHTDDGSKSDLSFVPPHDLWERVCAEADTCTAAQCQAEKNCFLANARREVAKADLIIVNHHMLFSDLAIKRELGSFTALAVLPAFERVILDEAHHIEDSATEYFGVEATQNGALNLLSRFYRLDRGRPRGLLPLISAKLRQEPLAAPGDWKDEACDAIEEQLISSVAIARDGVTTAFQALRSLAAERCAQIGRDIKWRLTAEALQLPELRDIHTVHMLPAAKDLTTLAEQAEGLAKKLRKILEFESAQETTLGSDMVQLEAYRDRLLRLANTMAEGTRDELEENTVRWVEIDAKRSDIVRVVRCPLDIAKPLSEWVYPNLKTVAMTSATLTVGQRFDFLSRRIGLSAITDREVDFRALDSPFDFPAQCMLAVAEDMPPPDAAEFREALNEFLFDALIATKGHAFVLFTSFSALNFAYNALEERLAQKGITPLKQGAMTRTRLLDRFRADPASVLFATDSFWEGVDVAGDALQCVILARLPFRVPTEPILEARAEAIELTGGNAFMDYTVPLAVIKLRQGFGRLIRRKSDRGAVLILDSRILTKRYGKTFLESLPLRPSVVANRGVVLSELSAFFSETRGAAHG